MNEGVIRFIADKLREVDKRNPEAFDLGEWGNRTFFAHNASPTPLTDDQLIDGCGSSGCIAGWTVLLTGRNWAPGLMQEAAAEAMDLPSDLASALMAPEHLKMDYSAVTAGMAATVLDHLADTGEVDWWTVSV